MVQATQLTSCNLTWNNVDGKLFKYFVCESILLRKEVDLGSKLSLKGVEHCVFDHEVAQLAVCQEHDVRGAAEVGVNVGVGVPGVVAGPLKNQHTNKLSYLLA